MCRSRPVNVAVNNGIDRKLDVFVQELERYQICVAGLQETKGWFEKDVWPAADG